MQNVNIDRTMVVDNMDQLCDLMCGDPEPDGDEHEYCLRCGRKLRSAASRMLGYGDTCRRKLEHENRRMTRLF